MNLISSAADAFNNPNSPYYYLVGALFLVLIFGALALYLVLVNRKKKRDAKDATEEVPDNNTELTIDDGNADGAADKSDTVIDAPHQAESAQSPEPSDIPEEHAEKTESAVPDLVEQEQEHATQEEKPEKIDAQDIKTEETANQKEPDARQEPTETAIKEEPVQAAKPTKPKAQQAKPESADAAPAAKSTEKVVAKSTANKKTAPKKTAKPFIDRLIATESAHNVYNSLKNIILSYPGVKAKLTKDGETFIFGDRALAEIVLDAEKMGLYLYIEPKDVPKPLTVESGKDGLPSLLRVDETQVDAAQRVIVYAMNVSLLTRNERHRYVDYVKKAVEAKNRAKKK